LQDVDEFDWEMAGVRRGRVLLMTARKYRDQELITRLAAKRLWKVALMKTRMNTRSIVFGGLMIASIWAAIVSISRADVTVTSSSGVRAGISGIMHRPADKSIAVGVTVVDPSGTNITTFVIQRSSDLKSWTNYSATAMATGSVVCEVSDFTGPTNQFYRVRFINFQ
jgi:hypothetical protein